MSSIALLVIALAVYRATRLVTTDAITAPARDFLAAAFLIPDSDLTRKGQLARWLHKLVTCPWCVSVWLSAAAVAIFRPGPTWEWDVAIALALSAVTGILAEKV